MKGDGVIGGRIKRNAGRGGRTPIIARVEMEMTKIKKGNEKEDMGARRERKSESARDTVPQTGKVRMWTPSTGAIEERATNECV